MTQQWAHSQVTVHDDDRITINNFGDPDGGIDEAKVTSWNQLVAELGFAGWELVLMHRWMGSTEYWFKKLVL